MKNDFIGLLVKVLQLPIIAFIFNLCIRSEKILSVREFLWLGVAFVLNFLYLLTSIFTHDSFINGIALPVNIKYLATFWSKVLDDISFIFFFVPLYYFLLKKIAKQNQRVKQLLTYHKKVRILHFTILIFLVLLFIIISRYQLGLIPNFLLNSFKGVCLFFLAKFFKEIKHITKTSNILLSVGFYSWGILQFAAMFAEVSEHLGVINSIGFSISFISKTLIIIGIVLIVINFETKKAETIAEINIRKEELQKSSEVFENILKNTFHEITFPINSLASCLTNLSTYMNREHRSKFRDLEFHFERVKAIVAVAKSSYKPEISNIDENEFLVQTSFKNISINYLIEKAISSIKNSYQKINIEHNYGSSVLVRCNQNEIVQVLTNLIKNAIEAYENDAEKKIILRSYNQKKDLIDNEKIVIVEVEDFASGIIAEAMDKIWERGFSTKIVNEKTIVQGEGLYVVKELCSKNNVRIEVQSPVKVEHNKEYHQGTKFTLYFDKKRELNNGNIT